MIKIAIKTMKAMIARIITLAIVMITKISKTIIIMIVNKVVINASIFEIV